MVRIRRLLRHVFPSEASIRNIQQHTSEKHERSGKYHTAPLAAIVCYHVSDCISHIGARKFFVGRVLFHVLNTYRPSQCEGRGLAATNQEPREP
jgi:hypothetical protein